MKLFKDFIVYSFLALFSLLFIIENLFLIQIRFFPYIWQMGSKFDKEIWSIHGGFSSSQCIRGNMLHDLLTNYLYKGMDRKDVENLIGHNPEDDKYHSVDYYIGDCDGMAYLIVTYNENNKLKAVSYFVEY